MPYVRYRHAEKSETNDWRPVAPTFPDGARPWLCDSRMFFPPPDGFFLFANHNSRIILLLLFLPFLTQAEVHKKAPRRSNVYASNGGEEGRGICASLSSEHSPSMHSVTLFLFFLPFFFLFPAAAARNAMHFFP